MSAALEAAFQQKEVRPILLVYLDFPNDIICAHSWIGDIEMDVRGTVHKFLGVGNLGTISGLEQPEELRAVNIKMELSGIPPDLVAHLLVDHIQGRDALGWFGALDVGERTLIGAVPLFRAKLDNAQITIGVTAKIELNATNILAEWETPRISRFAGPDQQRLFPGDTFCDRVAFASKSEITWMT